MSFTAMAWASKQKTGKSPSKFILMMLADRANDEGFCWPSLDRIASDCEMSRSTVVRHTKFLEDIGFIDIIRRQKDGVDLPNRYQLKMEGVVSERNRGSVRETGGGSVRETHEPISLLEPIKEPINNKVDYYLMVFNYYKTFPNLKNHRTLTGEMKTAIDKFKKQTSATEDDFKKVIRRHSKIVESTAGGDYPVRARSLQELFGQKAYQASHLIGSEYLDDGKYGSDYVVGKTTQTNEIQLGMRY